MMLKQGLFILAIATAASAISLNKFPMQTPTEEEKSARTFARTLFSLERKQLPKRYDPAMTEVPKNHGDIEKLFTQINDLEDSLTPNEDLKGFLLNELDSGARTFSKTVMRLIIEKRITNLAPFFNDWEADRTATLNTTAKVALSRIYKAKSDEAHLEYLQRADRLVPQLRISPPLNAEQIAAITTFTEAETTEIAKFVTGFESWGHEVQKKIVALMKQKYANLP